MSCENSDECIIIEKLKAKMYDLKAENIKLANKLVYDRERHMKKIAEVQIQNKKLEEEKEQIRQWAGSYTGLHADMIKRNARLKMLLRFNGINVAEKENEILREHIRQKGCQWCDERIGDNDCFYCGLEGKEECPTNIVLNHISRLIGNT